MTANKRQQITGVLQLFSSKPMQKRYNSDD